MSSKYTSVYESHTNSHCEWYNAKNRNISFEYPPKSLHNIKARQWQLPKSPYPKQSRNRKFQTQKNPLGFHVSKNCGRILSAPLLTVTGFRKGGGVQSQQTLDPWQICCLSGQLNPPLGFTKHKISERWTRCKEESRSMLAWTICCAIVSWKLITNYCIPLETIAALRKHNVSWAVTYEYPILLMCGSRN